MRFIRGSLVFLIALGAQAQPAPSSPTSSENTQAADTSFTALIEAARATSETLDGAQRDQFWQDFAAEAFDFYQAHPEFEDGREALNTAFRIWGRDGTFEVITEALERVDLGADVWSDQLLGWVSLAYSRASRHDEYFVFLHGLKERLTHPAGVSAVLLRLSRQALLDGTESAARPHLERIVALAADSAAVTEAETYLRLAVGKVAPDFAARTVTGDTLRLSDLRGQVVLLDFWATHCSPCLPEIPYLVEAHNAYADQGLTIVGISQDWDEGAFETMVEERRMTWTHILEPPSPSEGASNEVTQTYHVRWIPQTFLIDREGRIVAKDIRGDAVAQAVAALL